MIYYHIFQMFGTKETELRKTIWPCFDLGESKHQELS